MGLHSAFFAADGNFTADHMFLSLSPDDDVYLFAGNSMFPGDPDYKSYLATHGNTSETVRHK